MPSPLAAVGLITGAIGAIGSIFGAKKANKSLNNLLKQDPTYAANPIAQDRVNLAQSLLQARMPGAAAMERNIYSTQGNTTAGIGRNATDSSQALALGAASQGQSNVDLNKLFLQENDDYYQRLGILNQAQQGMINEGDKVYNDQIRRFEDTAKVRGAQIQNNQQVWNSLSGLGAGMTNLGLMSGGGGFNFGSLFGGGGGGGGGISGNYMSANDISASQAAIRAQYNLPKYNG